MLQYSRVRKFLITAAAASGIAALMLIVQFTRVFL